MKIYICVDVEEVACVVTPLADLCGAIPGGQRLEARTVASDCGTIVDAIGWTNVCSSISARLR